MNDVFMLKMNLINLNRTRGAYKPHLKDY